MGVETLSVIEIIKRHEAVLDEGQTEYPSSPEEILAQCEQLAISSVNQIRALARNCNCDPEQLARSLDKIDFALGQAFRDLHSD